MEFLQRHRRKFLLVGIGVCVVAIVLTLNPAAPNVLTRGVAAVVTPVQRVFSGAAGWFGGHFRALARNAELLDENLRLQLRVEELQLANAMLQQAADENALFTDVLNMQQQFAELPTMGARIIGHDPDAWVRAFYIDRGTNHGVADNMPILAGGGIAGITRYVTATRATVVSIFDSRFSAAVISRRTEDMATINGCLTLMPDGLMRLTHFDAAAQIMPGDEIITAPHSLFFPQGLTIGTVQEVRLGPDGITRYATLRPAASLDGVEMVLVVVP